MSCSVAAAAEGLHILAVTAKITNVVCKEILCWILDVRTYNT
jgi:hypothetical protein